MVPVVETAAVVERLLEGGGAIEVVRTLTVKVEEIDSEEVLDATAEVGGTATEVEAIATEVVVEETSTEETTTTEVGVDVTTTTVVGVEEAATAGTEVDMLSVQGMAMLASGQLVTVGPAKKGQVNNLILAPRGRGRI